MQYLQDEVGVLIDVAAAQFRYYATRIMEFRFKKKATLNKSNGKNSTDKKATAKKASRKMTVISINKCNRNYLTIKIHYFIELLRYISYSGIK